MIDDMVEKKTKKTTAGRACSAAATATPTTTIVADYPWREGDENPKVEIMAPERRDGFRTRRLGFGAKKKRRTKMLELSPALTEKRKTQEPVQIAMGRG
ncbi:VWA domain-containing protein [Sesbania bispinosa]|nr:VWA domain-containing protein [Sesbania bispinosa]